MNLLSISMRNLRIRLLSSSITMVSIALGTALLAAIWLMMDEARKRYSASTSNKSYTAIIGPKEGSPLELVLNTVFNYGISQGLVPYSLYRELHSGRLRKKGMVIYAIPQARGDGVPAGGGVADPEFVGGLAVEAPGDEVGPRDLAFRRAQRLPVEGLRELVRFEDLLRDTGVAGSALLFDLDPDFGGERPRGFGKLEPFVLHQEAEDVAALAASEAVEDLPVGVDVEARRLLVVEGAESLPVRPGLLQLDVAGDEGDDVRPVSDFLDGRFRDQIRPLATESSDASSWSAASS